MKNKIEIYTHEMFGEIRVQDKDGNPWFIAKDVTKALGFSNPSDATKYLDDDEKTLILNPSGNGGSKTTIVNESGLYSLVLRSRKPEAKKFKKWVTSEVLPSIRKTGGYGEPLSFEEQVNNVLCMAQERVKALEMKVEEDAPKVEFAETVQASDDVCQMAVACQVAKLPFGRNTLYQKLRELGVMISGGDRHNLPKQQYINQGLFTVNENKISNPKTGEPIITFTSHVTQKGIDWLIKKFRDEAA